MLDTGRMVELVEKGEFVEFSTYFRELSRKKRYHDINKIADGLYQKFDPVNNVVAVFRDSEILTWELNKLAFVIAVRSVAKGLATSQIRKFLNMSSSIYRKSKSKAEDNEVLSDIVKLNYLLAYAVGRDSKGKRIEPIAEVADKLFPLLNKQNYEKFHSFLQAIVAYHKLLGGGD